MTPGGIAYDARLFAACLAVVAIAAVVRTDASAMRRALASATTGQLIEWARPKLVFVARRRLKKWERDNVIRAAKSIGAKKVERGGCGWVWQIAGSATLL